MVDKVDAFKCGLTGRIHGKRKDAVECEFRAMMKYASGKLPNSYGRARDIETAEVFDWIACHIAGGVYPSAIDELERALEFWRENTVPRPPKLELETAPEPPGGE